MGHYRSEMYYDNRTEEQKLEDAQKAKRKVELEKKICKVFDCKRSELKVVANILKESWNYRDY